MARELNSNELNNLKAAIEFLRRLRECCPSLKANRYFEGAFEEIVSTSSSDEELRDWWKAGDDDTLAGSDFAVTERRLWILWVKHVWFRPDVLCGDRQLSLASCNGREIAKLAFIMLHEAYHLNGWSDGYSLYQQDVQNLATWELNLLFQPECQSVPCKEKILEYVKAQLQEAVNIVNEENVWYRRLRDLLNPVWLLRYVLVLLGVIALIVALGMALPALIVLLLIALILTGVWWVLERLLGH